MVGLFVSRLLRHGSGGWRALVPIAEYPLQPLVLQCILSQSDLIDPVCCPHNVANVLYGHSINLASVFTENNEFAFLRIAGDRKTEFITSAVSNAGKFHGVNTVRLLELNCFAVVSKEQRITLALLAIHSDGQHLSRSI